MRELTDDEIAEIGATTGLKYLPDWLFEDQWNNCEQWLFDFARKCIKASIDDIIIEYNKEKI